MASDISPAPRVRTARIMDLIVEVRAIIQENRLSLPASSVSTSDAIRSESILESISEVINDYAQKVPQIVPLRHT